MTANDADDRAAANHLTIIQDRDRRSGPSASLGAQASPREIDSGGEVTIEFWNTLGTVTQMAASIVTVVGILFIARQVSDTRRFTRSQLLNDLEKESKEYRQVYMMLTGPWRNTQDVSPQEEQLHDIFDCLGFFERIKILLDNRVVDMATVDRLFAYRFFSSRERS